MNGSYLSVQESNQPKIKALSKPLVYYVRDANGQIVFSYNGFGVCEPKVDSIEYLSENIEHIIEYARIMLNSLFYDSAYRPNESIITVSTFLGRVIQSTKISGSTIITALVLINRLKVLNPSCKGSGSSGHRLLLASILIASKTMSDDTYDNKSWAKASDGFFDLDQVNQMEKEFLKYLDYRVFVSPGEWTSFARTIGNFESLDYSMNE